jgi:zinc protease
MSKSNYTRRKKWIRWAILLVSIPSIFFLFQQFQAFNQPKDKKRAHMVNQLSGYQKTQGELFTLEKWELENGTRVHFVEAPTLPMVDVLLTFDAGSARDGDKHGVSLLTCALLSEGTESLDADKLAETLEQVGAQFSCEPGTEMASIRLRTLTDKNSLETVVSTISGLLKSPSFPKKGFEREQKNVLVALKNEAQSPSAIAARAFYESIYPNQPYANRVLGDEKSVTKLSPKDVKAFFKQHYVTNNLTMSIVGALNAEAANQVAMTLTAGLEEGEKLDPIPEVKALTQAFEKRVDFSSSQNHIVIGAPGLKFVDPDYFALVLGNHILGGNASVSRIFSIVRSQQGLAYDAHSYFLPMRELGPFILGCQTEKSQAPKAVALIKQTLREFIDKGPTTQELEDAKNNILGSFALRFDSNHAIAEYVKNIGFYDLPIDFYHQYRNHIKQVTQQDIIKAFQTRVHPDKMAVIIVGEKAGDKVA